MPDLLRKIPFAEDLFAAHFPGYPVVPATLLIEGLAQTGGILVGDANDFREKVVLAKIPKARFHAEALPGQELTYDVTLVQLRAEGAVVEGRVTAAGGRPVAEAEIYFAHLDQSRSHQVFGDRAESRWSRIRRRAARRHSSADLSGEA